MSYKPVYRVEEEHKIAHVCAWCDPEHALDDAWIAKGYRVSHGLCPGHGAEMEAEAHAMPQETLGERLKDFLEEGKLTYRNDRYALENFELAASNGQLYVQYILCVSTGPHGSYTHAPNGYIYIYETVDSQGNRTVKTSPNAYGHAAPSVYVYKGQEIPAGFHKDKVVNWQDLTKALKYANIMQDIISPADWIAMQSKWATLATKLAPSPVTDSQMSKVAAFFEKGRQLNARVDDLLGTSAYMTSRMMNGGSESISPEWAEIGSFEKIKAETAKKWKDQLINGWSLVRTQLAPGTEKSKANAKALMIKHGLIVSRKDTHLVMDESQGQWDQFTLQDFISVAERDSEQRKYFFVAPDFHPAVEFAKQFQLYFGDLGSGKGVDGAVSIADDGMHEKTYYNAHFPISHDDISELSARGFAWLGDWLVASWGNKDYPDWESELYQLLKDRGMQLAVRTLGAEYADLVFVARVTSHAVMDEAVEVETGYSLEDVSNQLSRLYWIKDSTMGQRVVGNGRFMLSFSDKMQCAFCAFCPGVPPATMDLIYLSNEPSRNEKDPVLMAEVGHCPIAAEVLALSRSDLSPSNFLRGCIQVFNDNKLVTAYREGPHFVPAVVKRRLTPSVVDESVSKTFPATVAVGLDVEVYSGTAGFSWVPAMILKETKWLGKKAWHVLLENGEDIIREDLNSEIRMRKAEMINESPPEEFLPGDDCLLKYGDKFVPVKFVKDVGEVAPLWIRTYRVKFVDGSTIYKPGSDMDTYSFNVVRAQKRTDTPIVVDEATLK